MYRSIFFFFFAQILLLPAYLHGQGWSVRVEADGFAGEYLLLGYYLGNSQYVKDTATAQDGIYTFSGTDTLHAGVYLVIFPPDNQYFQLIVGDRDSDIGIKVHMEDISHPYEITGSDETVLFYDYIGFLEDNRPQAEALRRQADTVSDTDLRSKITKQLEEINAGVKAYQEQLLIDHPHSVTALLITSNLETEVPEFTGTTDEQQLKTWQFVKAHYFDHIPMRDPRVARTPVLHQKIDYYLNKLTQQSPDSIIASIDHILGLFDPASEAFRIYLVHFLNTYAKSNIVGMDAVYVHIADTYYGHGLATWTDEETLQKILKNARTIRPLLIGKTAPDLVMQDRNGQKVRLHDIEAPYIVMFFWDPDCGHCKKSIPGMKTFYETYHPKGVQIFAVCTSLQDEVKKCWEAVDEREMGDWMHLVDPYLRSRFKQIYDIKTTPQIYILDKDKKIVMKKIGAEQLPEVLDRLMENGS